MGLVLVGGGSRSGKSRYALELARLRGSKLAFVATAQATDGEMRARAEAHQRERGNEFVTFEEPLEVPQFLAREAPNYDAIVVDCLTLWLSNLMLSEDKRDVAALTQQLTTIADGYIVLVTNEVGCGIVPENVLAREFRDRAGRMNQDIALVAEAVYWMAFGIPIKVK